MSWHLDKRLMIGLLVATIPTFFISIWNTSFLMRTLDTDPPIVQRLVKLEYYQSEAGRINRKILDELEKATKERRDFRDEQFRRTTTVNDAADHMKDRKLHKGR